jgi:hypothetical protein
MAPALGKHPVEPGWRDLSVLVFNRARNEFLVTGGSGNQGINALLYEADSYHQELHPDSVPGKGTPALPADWANGAEIGFFNSVNLGRINFPCEIRGVDLER